MNFEKKLVILSGKTGKGTALIERNGVGTFVTLNAFSLPDLRVGEYALGVKTRESVFRREVGSLGRIKSRFALPDGEYASVHLVLFRTDDEEVVLYGSLDAPRLWEANVMDGLRSERLENKTHSYIAETAAEAAGEFDYGKKTVEDYFLEIDPSRYRDGAVAEDNYFEREKREYYSSPLSPSELERKYLGSRYGKAQLVRKPAEEAERNATETIFPHIAPRYNPEVEGRNAQQPISPRKASSYTADEAVQKATTRASFYSTVKPKIDRLFSQCERLEPLERALPDTRWVRVDYDASGRYYAVGLIGSAPDCIGYGVPGKFGESPSALGGADFVPVDGLKAAEGFWVLFQSAETGKEVKNI